MNYSIMYKGEKYNIKETIVDGNTKEKRFILTNNKKTICVKSSDKDIIFLNKTDVADSKENKK